MPIAGAGPTGPTAAVELARRGIVAAVVEKRGTASPFSRAVGILPASMSILAPSGDLAHGAASQALLSRQGSG